MGYMGKFTGTAQLIANTTIKTGNAIVQCVAYRGTGTITLLDDTTTVLQLVPANTNVVNTITFPQGLYFKTNLKVAKTGTIWVSLSYS
jgi:hypothetical protein